MQLHSMRIQKPIKLCNCYGRYVYKCGVIYPSAAMAGKPRRDIDLRPAKRAASSGFIGRRVNIYVTILSSILFQSQWSYSVSSVRKHYYFCYP